MSLRRPLAAVLACLAFTTPVSAQAIRAANDAFLPFTANLPRTDALYEPFWQSLGLLLAEENRQRNPRGSISAGFNGDESDSSNLFKLTTAAEFARGTYPGELRFTANVGVTLKDGTFQEDVTRFLVNYDYHHKAWVEYYAFAERFTDNFLSISQRYEAGFGLQVGHWFGLHEPGTDALEALDGPLPGATALQAARPAPRPLQRFHSGVDSALAAARTAAAGNVNLTAPSAAVIEALNTSGAQMRQAIIERNSVVFFGLAVSTFAELEQAAIKSPVSPLLAPVPESKETKTFSLQGERRFRLTLRPTLILRPTSSATIAVYPYFKLPLDGPRHVRVDGEKRLDYRRDIRTSLTVRLAGDDTGRETVDFVVRLEHYYDNVPPRIPQATLDGETAAGRAVATTAAQHSHRVAALELKIGWGS